MATLPIPGQETWAQELLNWLNEGHDMAAFPEVGDYPWAQPLLDALLIEHNPDGTHIGGVGPSGNTLVLDSDGAQVTDSDGDTVAAVDERVTVPHSQIPSTSFHQAFHYEQLTDPGAVGAGLWWADTTTNTLKRRNDANTDWETFL